MKNIAIVTGASSGMGKEFALTVPSHVKVDEMWVIARRGEHLAKLQEEVKVPIKVFELDLSKDASFDKIKDALEKEQVKVNIKLLINAAGFGRFDKTTNVSYEDNIGMIKLNCEGLVKMCLLSLPYMSKGSKIINFASVAAVQPVPYINVYASTKAFVLSFSRALNSELEKDGIHVMALCPFWTKTKFFDRAVSQNKIVKKYTAMYESDVTIKRAWKDLEKGKDVSKYGFIARAQMALSKILPHKIIMKIWKKQQDLD